METRLTNDMLHRIRHQLKVWLTKRKANKRQILSLVGLLQHATIVVCPGHTFLARMYSTASKLKQPSDQKRLSAAFRSDLCWWHVFITYWNRVSFLHLVPVGSIPDYFIETDASSSCGVVYGLPACGSITSSVAGLQFALWLRNSYLFYSAMWCSAPLSPERRFSLNVTILIL